MTAATAAPTIIATLYEIAAHIGSQCFDGPSNHGVWDHEKQFHATREPAEEAVARAEASFQEPFATLALILPKCRLELGIS